MSKSELACVYAILALADDGVEVTAENILTLTKAAGIEVEPYWPGLFAKLVEKKSVEDFITNVGAGGGAPAAGAAAPAAGGAAAAAEEKKEEKVEEEEDEDMGFSLFD